MTINEGIAALQAEAAIMPGGGENPIRLMTVHRRKDNRRQTTFWEIEGIGVVPGEDGTMLIKALEKPPICPKCHKPMTYMAGHVGGHGPGGGWGCTNAECEESG